MLDWQKNSVCGVRKGSGPVNRLWLLVLAAGLWAAPRVSAGQIEYTMLSSGPAAPRGFEDSRVEVIPQSAYLLSEVPTSSWTYGCSNTAAGMLFGYYDRVGYGNMYTGPANNGLAPLTDLGSQCSLIEFYHDK